MTWAAQAALTLLAAGLIYVTARALLVGVLALITRKRRARDRALTDSDRHGEVQSSPYVCRRDDEERAA